MRYQAPMPNGLRVLVVLAAISTPGLVRAGEAEDVKAAEAATAKWLATVDDAKYEKAWDDAASLFQSAMSVDAWEQRARATRGPLGAVRSRKLRAATFTKVLPGAPDGAYVIIRYDTQFERKREASETLTPMREKDGAWKVAGYYIK